MQRQSRAGGSECVRPDDSTRAHFEGAGVTLVTALVHAVRMQCADSQANACSCTESNAVCARRRRERRSVCVLCVGVLPCVRLLLLVGRVAVCW